MKIDFQNVCMLIQGQTYLVTLPEMDFETTVEVGAQLEQVSNMAGVRFVLICGDGIKVEHQINQGQVN